MAKIIVTGGTGFIGSHTAVELIQNGHEPVLLDNLSNSSENVLEGIKEITGVCPDLEKLDVRDRAATTRFFNAHKDAKGVIHFAALKAVGESVEKPLLYYENNLGGLINVLFAMQESGVASIIFSSSATVYGQPKKLPATEKSPVLPAESPYGYSKQAGERILSDFIENPNNYCSAIALRYFNPIGAHPSASIGELPLGVPSNLMPFITQTAAGIRKELKVFGSDYNTKDGTAVRDYIHVVDIAKAHVVAIDRLIHKRNKLPYEVFNLGTGKGNTVLEVIQSFEKTSNHKLPYVLTDRRPGDVESVYASTTLANEELGWKAQFSIDDMTRDAWRWEKKLRGIL